MLTGTAVSGIPGFFNLTSLTVNGAGVNPNNVGNTGTAQFVETGPLLFSIFNSAAGSMVSTIVAAPDGTTINLTPSPPVPEASTTVSFGALLALGGLALVLRRKGAKNAA